MSRPEAATGTVSLAPEDATEIGTRPAPRRTGGALVTGASAGIGAAIARRLAAAIREKFEVL